MSRHEVLATLLSGTSPVTWKPASARSCATMLNLPEPRSATCTSSRALPMIRLFSNRHGKSSPSCVLTTPAASVTSLLTTPKGVNVMHGVNPALVGRDLYDFKDPNGVLMIQQLIAAAQQGGDYTSYSWENTETNAIEPKLGYSIMLPEWNIMLGTGFWISGLEQQIAQLEQQVAENIRDTLVGSLVTALVALIIIVGLALLVVRTISRPLVSTVAAMNDVALGDGDLTRRLSASGQDEIAQLGRAFNSFADQVQGMVKNINSTSATLSDSSIELAELMAQAEQGVE